MVHHK